MGAGDRPSSRGLLSARSGSVAVGVMLSLFLAGDRRTERDEPAPDSDTNADSRPTTARRSLVGANGLERVVKQAVETGVDGLMKLVEMGLDHGPFGGRAE